MKVSTKPTTKDMAYRRKPLITALEARILLDGAAVATAADAMTDVDVQDQSTLDDAATPVGEALAPVNDANNSQHLELAFVDARIEDYQSLIDSLDAAIEVHVIDADVDGLEAMVSMLGEQDVSGLHVYSHGNAGELRLGSTVLTLDTLDANASQLKLLGDALTEDGDILLYGCSVAADEQGTAFISRVAELTGADVAASEDLTGADEHGGDWDLEFNSGTVETAVMAAEGFDGILTAPAVNNLSSITLNEGDPAIQVDSDIAFSGASNLGGGYIEFSLSSYNSGDQFSLSSGGNITVSGQSVYHNGTFIGTIDSTFNGQNGTKLRVNFESNFSNPSFEDGTNSWTIGTSRVILGSTVINGHLTPDDTTDPPNSGDDAGSVSSMSYNYDWTTTQFTEGSHSLRLYNRGTTSSGYDVVHGPYAYSNTFLANAGDNLYFDWRAAAGGDAFDAFGYMMKADGSQYVVVLDQTGANDSGRTAWATSSVTVPTTGDWYFVFVAGTYDFTGGRAVGGSLYIDNFQVFGNSVNDTVLNDLARQVQYQNTGTDSQVTRNLTVSVSDGSNNVGSATSTLTINQANNSPSFTGGASLAAVDEDTTAPGGSSVSSLFGGLYSDPDTAYTPADTLAGIVVTGDASNPVTEGEWQYTTDGSNWYAVGSVSSSAGLMLPSSSMLRFVPVADYNGTPGSLSVHAVDSSTSDPFTSGATRTTFDTTADAAGSAVSASATTLSTSITSINDAPVGTPGPASANLIEAGGVLNGNAGVSASSLTNALSDVDGTPSFDTAYLTSNGWTTSDGGLTYVKTSTYGAATLTIASGVVSYQLDNNDVDTQALLAADNVNENFVIGIIDDLGATSTATAVFNLQGANDNPVAADGSDNAVEASGVENAVAGSNASGNMLASVTDVDSVANGETKTIVGIRTGTESGSGTSGLVGTALVGQYGTLTLNSNGTYTYVVDDDNPDVQALRVSGQQLVDSFTYTVQDTAGLQDTGTFSFNIDGRNDAPVLTDAVVEDKWPFGKDDSLDFSTLFNDVDSTTNGENLTYTITGLPTGLTYNPNTGVVSGKPTVIGKFMLNFTVQDASGAQITRQFELEIVAPPKDGSTSTAPPSDPPPPPEVDTTSVDVGFTELPDGLVDDGGDGSTESGFLKSDGGDGEALGGQDGGVLDGDGIPDDGVTVGEADGIGDGSVSDDIGDAGAGSEAAESDETESSDNTGDTDVADSGTSSDADEVVVVSSDGAMALETKTADGNVFLRAVVDINVGTDGKVTLTEAHRDAFSVVSMNLTGIQSTAAGGFTLSIFDSRTDKVQTYVGTLGDGSPLPGWVQLDSRTGALSVNPPSDLGELILRIETLDSDGQIRLLELKLDLKQLRERLGVDERESDEAEAARFQPLSEQLQAQQGADYGQRLAKVFGH